MPGSTASEAFCHTIILSGTVPLDLHGPAQRSGLLLLSWQARQLSWQRLKDVARQQFLWPYPGRPREEGVDDSHVFCPEVRGPYDACS